MNNTFIKYRKIKDSKLYFLISISFIFIISSSCRKEKCEEKIPEIEFKEFLVYDSVKAKLVIGFYDCDADIGLSDSDTLSPYEPSGQNYYNLYLYYWELRNGNWVKWEDLTPPFYYRVPRVETENASYPLKGDITIDLEPIYFVPISPYDTIKFEIQLVDRALNKSNTVFTNDIIKP